MVDVHRILVATAVQVLGQATPTSMIGIDETRARSVRWFFKVSGRARSDPWMTSIVDLDPTPPGGDHRARSRPLGGVRRGLACLTDQGVPRQRHGRGDRPVSSIRARDPAGVAAGQDRPGPLSPGDVGG